MNGSLSDQDLSRLASTQTLQKLTVGTCLVPTEEAGDADKDNFYEQLQAIIEKVPAHDVLLVIGDMNARTGMDNTNRERTIGREGLGTHPMNG